MIIPFGFLALDKPEGITSHDCIKQLRKIYGIKRIGHGGTLDPAVTGVLPIAIGKATRLLQFLPADKAYKGIIQLGTTTKSDDITGEIISETSWPELEKETLEKYFEHFRGELRQFPPQISSIHFKGERAYKRARRGEIMELPSREINIYSLKIIKWNQHLGQIEIEVHCSSGTYIRSLARDLGEKVGCGGCLRKLRRTKALGLGVEQSIALEDIFKSDKDILSYLISPEKALGFLPYIDLKTEEELLYWRRGREIRLPKARINLKIKNDLEELQLSEILVKSNQSHVEGIGEWDHLFGLKPKIVLNGAG